jgi:DNA-binding MarR family transcriptional regulator
MFFFFLDPTKQPVFGPQMLGFEKAIDEFREVDGAMTVNTLSTLVHISRRLPALAFRQETLRDISSQMAMPHSSFIRHLATLSEGGPGLKSMNLLERGIDPKGPDKRERLVRLAPDGLRLLRTVERHLTKGD